MSRCNLLLHKQVYLYASRPKQTCIRKDPIRPQIDAVSLMPHVIFKQMYIMPNSQIFEGTVKIYGSIHIVEYSTMINCIQIPEVLFLHSVTTTIS